MSSQPTQILDTVALVTDLPELGLFVGEVGVVVELLGDDAFEVEFVNASGRTYGVHTLEAWQRNQLQTLVSAMRFRAMPACAPQRGASSSPP